MVQANPYNTARLGSTLSAAHSPATINTPRMRRGQASVRTSTLPTALHRGHGCDHVAGVFHSLIAGPFLET
jgi:hypothetical protein